MKIHLTVTEVENIIKQRLEKSGFKVDDIFLSFSGAVATVEIKENK